MKPDYNLSKRLSSTSFSKSIFLVNSNFLTGINLIATFMGMVRTAKNHAVISYSIVIYDIPNAMFSMLSGGK